MPARERTKARNSRGRPQARPPGPGPPQLAPRAPKTSAPHPWCQPQPAAHKAKPRKIVFEDELPSRASRGTKRPVGAATTRPLPRPDPVPDYELSSPSSEKEKSHSRREPSSKYPQVSSERDRSRYAAVFQDQYGEFVQLQQELASAQARLGQLEALLASVPPPRSQSEAQTAARVWRELEKKRTDPAFLDKQARCRYLQGKLRHLKGQIQKYREQVDSEGSVYF